MARTLKDVYIKVTHANISDLRLLLNYSSLDINDNLIFYSDAAGSFDFCETNSLLDREKVSLSELKRLIDTIPTREEITRLKRQKSAYKTNYDKAVKHSLSKEDVIEELRDNEIWLRYKLNERDKEIKQLNEMYYDLVLESGKKQNLLKNLYDDALKENDDLKLSNEKSLKKIYDLEKKLKHVVDKNELQGDLIEEKNFKISDLEKIKEDFADVIIYRNKEIAKLSEELERLKTKKWWHIWK